MVLATIFRPDVTGYRGTLVDGLSCHPTSCQIRLDRIVNTMEFCDTSIPVCQRATVTGNVIQPTAGLSILKVANKATAQPGEQVTYTITITNTQADATNVVFTDARPASQMTLVSVTSTKGTVNT